MLAAVDWTVVGVLLTAVFTGVGLIVAFLAYQHGRQIAGFRKPLVIRRGNPIMRSHTTLGRNEARAWERTASELGPECLRIIPLHIFNYSNAEQTLNFEQRSCRVVRPFSCRHARVLWPFQEELSFKPHSGGTVYLLLVNAKPWPGKRLGCRIRLKGLTRGHKAIRFRGRVTLLPFSFFDRLQPVAK